MRRGYRVDESVILNPGRLRHQITWQRKTVTEQDSMGQDVYTWEDVQACRAAVKTLAGLELNAARQRFAEARYHLMQHYVPGLTCEMQIQWYLDGEVRTLDVLSIDDEPGTGRYQAVIAKDYVP